MTFDPYHKWLGIPAEKQPPTHYQLLGVSPHEVDASVIDESATMRTAHVQSHQKGPNASACKQLLVEIEAARTTLSDPKQRSQYNAKLFAAAAENAPLTSTYGLNPTNGTSEPAREPRVKTWRDTVGKITHSLIRGSVWGVHQAYAICARMLPELAEALKFLFSRRPIVIIGLLVAYFVAYPRDLTLVMAPLRQTFALVTPYLRWLPNIVYVLLAFGAGYFIANRFGKRS